MKVTRRNLVVSSASGAFMALAAPGLRVSLAARGEISRDILVVLFARGGADGLQLVAPANENAYQDARPNIAVQANGSDAGININNGLDGVDFFFNPNARGLSKLYGSGNLALIHAAGVPTESRSHFKSMDMMERGLADNEIMSSNGWLTRHILSLAMERPPLSTISTTDSNPISLLGCAQAVSIPDIQNQPVFGGETYKDIVGNLRTDHDASNQGVAYTNGPLSTTLRSLAKLIKMEVGLDIATVDHNSWDHHNNLPHEFGNSATELSRSLSAFWADIVDFHDRVTLVFMTEFGRNLAENKNAGTNHGSGSVMMVLSGNANGGRMYGDWPGLSRTNLDKGALAVTTDYRQVISEVLAKRHGSTSLESIFPTVPYEPLGFLNGDDSTLKDKNSANA